MSEKVFATVGAAENHAHNKGKEAVDMLATELAKTLTKFRNLYPGPYLDKSLKGMALRSVLNCAEYVNDLRS